MAVERKLPANWNGASTWQDFTWRTELLGCRWSGVTSTFLFLSSSSRLFSWRFFYTDRHSTGSDWRRFVFSLSDECLLNRDGRSGDHKSAPTRKVTITITTDWLMYIDRLSCTGNLVWYVLLQTLILSLSTSCHEVDCLFADPFDPSCYIYIYVPIAARTRRLGPSPETGPCTRIKASAPTVLGTVYVCMHENGQPFVPYWPCVRKNNECERMVRCKQLKVWMTASTVSAQFGWNC